MIVATRHLLVTRVESKVNNGLKLMLLGSDRIIISLYRMKRSPSHNPWTMEDISCSPGPGDVRH